jgi:hypothetical protein
MVAPVRATASGPAPVAAALPSCVPAGSSPVVAQVGFSAVTACYEIGGAPRCFAIDGKGIFTPTAPLRAGGAGPLAAAIFEDSGHVDVCLGEECQSFLAKGPFSDTQVTPSEDGKLVALFGGSLFAVYEVATGKALYKVPLWPWGKFFVGARFFGDRVLVGAGDGGVRTTWLIVDIRTGRRIGPLAKVDYAVEDIPPLAVGKLHALAGFPARVFLQDLATGKLGRSYPVLGMLPESHRISQLLRAPDDRLFVQLSPWGSGEEDALLLLDPKSGALTRLAPPLCP